jgi:hypothetical protein
VQALRNDIPGNKPNPHTMRTLGSNSVYYSTTVEVRWGQLQVEGQILRRGATWGGGQADTRQEEEDALVLLAIHFSAEIYPTGKLLGRFRSKRLVEQVYDSTIFSFGPPLGLECSRARG